MRLLTRIEAVPLSTMERGLRWDWETFPQWMDSLAKHAIEKADGFTPQQQFFLGYGQIWCENSTEQERRQRIATDPHSPGEFRVNGVLRNLPEFGEAFSCKAGDAMVSENPCRVCGGQGRTRREKTLQVSIPAGVEDGNRIRLSGEGEAGVRGGAPGDLYIFLAVKPHRFFQRDGANIHCRVPITMPTAALGGGVEVPAIVGSRCSLNCA